MSNNTILILICGGSGSGKSTIANKIFDNLSKKIQGEIICQDSYYVDADKISIDNFNFDHPNAFDLQIWKNDIKNILNGNKTQIPKYNYVLRKKELNSKEIYQPKFLIVEGLYSLYDNEINQLANLKIFVETPKDECLIRRILRDVDERQRELHSIIKQWRSDVKPMYNKFIEPLKLKADLIIPWTNQNENALNILNLVIANLVK